MNRDLKEIRENYNKGYLIESEVLANPLEQFTSWFDDYKVLKRPDFNAMVISTVNAEGFPSSRVVLLKEIRKGQFVFFTNYNSQKGKDIEANPKVSLLFFWQELERQIRICGTVERISTEESTNYFKSRPLESQIGALTSPQSEIIPDRNYLELKYQQNFEKYNAEKSLKRPENWGGYAVTPISFEFWQGRSSRLHDRLFYQLQSNGTWSLNRLAP